MRFAGLLALAMLTACRTQSPSLTTRDVAELSASTGAVSSTLIKDPNAPTVELGPDEQFVPANLHPGNPAPAYPEELIVLGVPVHRIVVRILFDEMGRVLDIGPSPLEASTSSQFTSRFEETVCGALLNWRIWPPTLRKFRPGSDSDGDGKPDYRVLVDQKALKSFFDVAFTFEVVNGQPVVRQGTQ